MHIEKVQLHYHSIGGVPECQKTVNFGTFPVYMIPQVTTYLSVFEKAFKFF